MKLIKITYIYYISYTLYRVFDSNCVIHLEQSQYFIQCFNPSLRIKLSNLKMVTTVHSSSDIQKILKSYNHCLYMCNVDMHINYVHA